MRGEVVHDQVHVQFFGNACIQTVEAREKLLVSMAGRAFGEHSAGGDVEGGRTVRGSAVRPSRSWADCGAVTRPQLCSPLHCYPIAACLVILLEQYNSAFSRGSYAAEEEQMKFTKISLLLLVCLSASVLNASIIFTLGNNPSNDVNILLNSGATGFTVSGSPNGFPSLTVNFTSTQVLSEPSSGQARVAANPEGSPLTNLIISLANGFTYGDLIINPFIGGLCPTCTGGASTITVNAVSATNTPEAPFVFTGLNVGNGNNFLTIVATNGEKIVSTSVSVPGGFNDLRQPRISGPFVQIPEPASMSLLGSGLLGIAFLARQLRKA